MKKIIFATALLASQMALADQLPASWINDSEVVEETALPNFENTFDTHSEMAANLVEKDAGKRKWEMFGYVTTFGVSASGKIGLLASSGASAVEVYWRRKPVVAAVAAQPTKANLVADTSADQITDEDVIISNDESIEENVDEVLSVVKTKREIRITDRLRNEIRNEIQKLRNNTLAIEAMESSPKFNSNWFVKMLRLDLAISGEGALTNPAMTVGAELGVRIFWTRTVKKPQALNKNMSVAFAENKFSSAIANIMNTLDAVNVEEHTQEAVKQGFKFDTIRLGLGMNATGDIVIGKGTGSAIMNIFFVKKPTPVVTRPNALAANDIQVEDEKGNLMNIPAAAFEKGLTKSFKMSEKIIAKAARKQNRKFEPYIIWNIFTFTRGGSLGLVKVNGVGQVHLFFNKK